jgi:hypothetical protein
MQRILGILVRHLNKCLLIILVALSFPGLVDAAELLIFDYPNMMMLRNGKKLTGYYGAVEGDKNCEFFFVQTEKLSAMEEGYLRGGVSSFSFAFPPESYRYNDRDKRFDSVGEVYELQDQRIVRIDNPEPGCVGWAVGSFGKKPGDKDAIRYTIESRIEAVGIRVVSHKAILYKKDGARFDRTHAYLVTGDVVVVLATSSLYAHVRYTDPNSAREGRVITGWLRSSDLVDPFPAASKQ